MTHLERSWHDAVNRVCAAEIAETVYWLVEFIREVNAYSGQRFLSYQQGFHDGKWLLWDAMNRLDGSAADYVRSSL